jgi:hypothetical protein
MPPLDDKQEEIVRWLAGFVAENMYRVGSKMLEFLILTNGGAAIACLGLIASSSPRANDYVVKLILAAFVIGLGLAGWITVRGFRYMTRMSFQFRATLDRIRAKTEPWEAMGKVFAADDTMQFHRSASLSALHL